MTFHEHDPEPLLGEEVAGRGADDATADDYDICALAHVNLGLLLMMDDSSTVRSGLDRAIVWRS